MRPTSLIFGPIFGAVATPTLDNPLVIGVFGAPATGKSWLIQSLLRSLPEACILETEKLSETDYEPTAVGSHLIQVKVPEYIWNHGTKTTFRQVYIRILEVGGIATLGYRLEEAIRAECVEQLQQHRGKVSQLQQIAAIVRTRQTALNTTRQKSEVLMRSVLSKRLLSVADGIIYGVDLCDISTVVDVLALHSTIRAELVRLGRSTSAPSFLITGLKRDLRANYPETSADHEQAKAANEHYENCVPRSLLLRVANHLAEEDETKGFKSQFGVHETSSKVLPWAGLLTLASVLRLSGRGIKQDTISGVRSALLQPALCCYTPNPPQGPSPCPSPSANSRREVGTIPTQIYVDGYFQLSKELFDASGKQNDGEGMQRSDLDSGSSPPPSLTAASFEWQSVDPIPVYERSPLSHILISEVPGVVTIQVCPQTFRALQFCLEHEGAQLDKEMKDTSSGSEVSPVGTEPRLGRFPPTQSRSMQRQLKTITFPKETTPPNPWLCTSRICAERSESPTNDYKIDQTKMWTRLILPQPTYANILLRPHQSPANDEDTDKVSARAQAKHQSLSASRLAAGIRNPEQSHVPLSSRGDAGSEPVPPGTPGRSTTRAKTDIPAHNALSPPLSQKLIKALGLAAPTPLEQASLNSTRLHSTSALALTPLKLHKGTDDIEDDSLYADGGLDDQHTDNLDEAVLKELDFASFIVDDDDQLQSSLQEPI